MALQQLPLKDLQYQRIILTPLIAAGCGMEDFVLVLHTRLTPFPGKIWPVTSNIVKASSSYCAGTNFAVNEK